MPAPIASPHLWQGHLPANLPPGTHEICVKATDANGKLHTAYRVITVEVPLPPPVVRPPADPVTTNTVPTTNSTTAPAAQP